VVRALASGGRLGVTLELLPQRIDFVGFVLQLAGAGSLVGLALAVMLGEDDALFAKYGTLVGAYTGSMLFLVLFSMQQMK
jgi:hypothetical protein